MASNPFDRNKTKEARLGHLIDNPGDQNQRDAVHIAVVPVKARNNLEPGQHVGVTPDGKVAGTPGGLFGEAVGIVDPFLTARVVSGDTFWLFLYQGSVNTLRHEWTHDAFPDAHGVAHTSREESVIWLKAYATTIKPYSSPEKAYESLLDDLQRNEVNFDGTDIDWELKDNAEFWRHAMAVIGKPLHPGDFYISCSC